MCKAGGKRLGAGRPKGSKGKRKAEIDLGIAASDMTPLDFMLTVMRNTKAAPALRFEAAKRSAPYVHPKLASIEHTGKDGGPIQHEMTNLEKARRIAFVLNKAAREAAKKE